MEPKLPQCRKTESESRGFKSQTFVRNLNWRMFRYLNTFVHNTGVTDVHLDGCVGGGGCLCISVDRVWVCQGVWVGVGVRLRGFRISISDRKPPLLSAFWVFFGVFDVFGVCSGLWSFRRLFFDIFCSFRYFWSFLILFSVALGQFCVFTVCFGVFRCFRCVRCPDS